MSADVIGFPLRRRTVAKPPRKPRRKRQQSALNKTLEELQSEAMTTDSCLFWLLRIAKRGHDVRAILAMIEKQDALIESREQLDVVVELVRQVAAEYGRRYPHKPPRLVK